ncbi:MULTISPECIES: head-tail adaptor protein [unclassified Lactococcus]|uniref:head-tail adaptor protein n=1 Tax=unclassified Lactococcus TaxID=2643510 RepID=UPI00142F5C33|nr:MULTISPECIES: head-tail adaptor protein [unclassified Lactococcus]KAF6609683.1 phage head-tail joining protein [Lactococcus sp. EKM201L]KAF6613691.1 phage head-tail joining protein [Lactococcus sp. EKM203L]KAF6640682.1 phage head-tail joining protein [Lactococcus sp. EKM501L]KAF6645946.1 phage head-tail joining protein [Lactococcus sp. EKM502L]KAF6651632.1 phage head-tail joining protein [Lactococcus sp. EKM101L]
MKKQINNSRWKAVLMSISNDELDENDRPQTIRKKKRDIFYQDIGITAQEKFLSKQDKTEVVRRIKVRWDKGITEKNSGIQIDSIDYNIERIYTNVDTREMELSLSYVN